jgi:hypothetical protein
LKIEKTKGIRPEVLISTGKPYLERRYAQTFLIPSCSPFYRYFAKKLAQTALLCTQVTGVPFEFEACRECNDDDGAEAFLFLVIPGLKMRAVAA